MTVDEQFGARLLADRKDRGMSRKAYAEMTGLTQAKIANIEKGRKPTEDELSRLTHLAFVDTGAAPATENGVTLEAPAADDDPVAAYNARKDALIVRYTEVYERLNSRPSAIPYSPFWGPPGQGDPSGWQFILKWCDEVDAWLDTVDGPREVPGDYDLPNVTVTVNSEEIPSEVGELPDGPDLGVQVGGFISDEGLAAPMFEDEVEAEVAEEEFLAQVTDAPWEFPDDEIRRISNGELKTFKECRRKWWLAYYRRLGLPTHAVTGAAQLGTRIHRCLAVHYVPAGQVPGDPFAELERTIQEDLLVVGGDEFKVADLMKERDLAHAMLEGYFEWLAETAADQGIEVVAPETKLEVDARMPDQEVHLIAKIDVRVTRTFGSDVARLFMDHKTVGDLTSPTKMLAFDEQMLHYDLCEYLDLLAAGVASEEAEAVRTDGALYNMIRKVKRTAAAKPPFYGRVEVRHNIHTLRSYWLRVKGEIDEIIALEAKLDAGVDHRQVAYPTPTRDCSWRCDFFHVCTMADDGSRFEDMLAGTYVTINPLQRYESASEGKTM